MKNSIIYIILSLFFANDLMAAQGARIMIYNLTDVNVQLEIGDEDNFTERALKSGTINSNSSYPSEPAYIQESGLSRSYLYLKFKSSLGNPTLKFEHNNKKFYFENGQVSEEYLHVQTSIHLSQKSGEQSIINIYLSRNKVNLKNWMGEIDGNTKLSAIAMPGTHDSGAYGKGTDYIPFVHCQTLNITEQLVNGSRYFDFRVFKDPALGTLQLTHNKVPLNKTFQIFALLPIQQFLTLNPTETVILQLNQEGFGTEDEVAALAKELLKSDLYNFYDKNSIPALKEVRGKMVLFNRVNSKLSGYDVTDWPHKGSTFKENSRAYNVQDKYEDIDADAKLKVIMESWDNFRENKYGMNYMSYSSPTEGTPLWLAEGALAVYEGMNFFFAEELQQRSQNGHKKNSNILVMDALYAPVAMDVIMSNFPYRGVKIPKENVDAICYNDDEETYYIFKDHQYWKRKKGEKYFTGPKNMSDWKIDSFHGIDAACYSSSFKTYYFFKGGKYWSKKSDYRGRLVNGNSITEWGEKMPSKVDAAIYKVEEGVFYFFSNTNCYEIPYTRDESQSKVYDIGSGWGTNTPNNLHAATYSVQNKKYYFLKDNFFKERKVGSPTDSKKIAIKDF